MKGNQKHIVIIGGGFGGIAAIQELKGKDVKVTLIDKSNHHLFQPLLYQVATAALSPGDIATPIREIAEEEDNINILLGEVASIVAENKKVELLDGRSIAYDQLVIAVGARYNYFGHDEWQDFAPGLKTVSDALDVRERILLSLEEAEQIEDEAVRKPFLTYVIIGGGPTGVEMAGAIAEITKNNIKKEYHKIRPEDSRIILAEASDGILNGYPKKLSLRAKKMLEQLGVEVMTNTAVTNIEKDKVRFKDGEVESPNIIWAAGVVANPLVKSLNAEFDKNGRVMVNGNLSLPNQADIFVIGDAAHVKGKDQAPLPSTASVAKQQGHYLGKYLTPNVAAKKQNNVFQYRDRGAMATIGKARAVAAIKGVNLSGLWAWLIWSFVHILFLIDFRNRFHVFIEWVWYYFTDRRGVRLITDRSACKHCQPHKSIKNYHKEAINIDHADIAKITPIRLEEVF